MLQPASAILFDYGNTLIQFGPSQLAQERAALSVLLNRFYPGIDLSQMEDIRLRQILSVYQGGFKESPFENVLAEMVNELNGAPPSDQELAALCKCREQAFVDSITLPHGVEDVLKELKANHRLGLVSNYPCGSSIRRSLEKTGIASYFDAVVISGEVGYVKPHPDMFRVSCEKIGFPADACIFVGDNWLGDMQGAKHAGMQAVHTTEYEPYKCFEEQPGDADVNGRINQLVELLDLL